MCVCVCVCVCFAPGSVDGVGEAEAAAAGFIWLFSHLIDIDCWFLLLTKQELCWICLFYGRWVVEFIGVDLFDGVLRRFARRASDGLLDSQL